MSQFRWSLEDSYHYGDLSKLGCIVLESELALRREKLPLLHCYTITDKGIERFQELDRLRNVLLPLAPTPDNEWRVLFYLGFIISTPKGNKVVKKYPYTAKELRDIVDNGYKLSMLWRNLEVRENAYEDAERAEMVDRVIEQMVKDGYAEESTLHPDDDERDDGIRSRVRSTE